MSWSPLAPPAFSLSKGAGAPPLTMFAAVGKRGQTVALTLRAAVQGQLPWLTPMAPVSVEIGHGEHAGLLRVTPGGPFRLLGTGGKPGRGGKVPQPLALRLPGLSGMGAGKQPATAVEFVVGDGWLQVTLPDWARPAAGATPVAVAPAPAPAGKAPFRTAATSGPDPFPHLRRGSGPVPTSSEPSSSVPRAARTPT